MGNVGEGEVVVLGSAARWRSHGSGDTGGATTALEEMGAKPCSSKSGVLR
jgi:hypothetical protein